MTLSLQWEHKVELSHSLKSQETKVERTRVSQPSQGRVPSDLNTAQEATFLNVLPPHGSDNP